MSMADPMKQLKEDTWTFYVLARSNDPMIKCLNTRNLVSSIITAMKILKEDEALLEMRHALYLSNKAWCMCDPKGGNEPGQAIEMANAVLDEISQYVYNEKYCSTKPNSFDPSKMGNRGEQ